MTTVRSYRVLKGVPKKCVHHKIVQSNARAKSYRFLKLVALKKKVENALKKTHKKTHMTMQSTSSCEFSSVSTLNELKLFLRKKERDTSKNKRYWEIRNNEGRELCLESYRHTYVLCYCIKNVGIYYLSWKYWHVVKNHSIAIAVAACC